VNVKRRGAFESSIPGKLLVPGITEGCVGTLFGGRRQTVF
jgi:hypothetical protein